ncbi:hypothetical protein V6S67_07165 [Arthrobacter sp. Soc17.1.1.1]|uniref:hypothetical protein n=1 Tax=Arthrobacter sp. Soc17.1.1.1 TaxID=3121277 RepID=UPI002FE4512F
MVAVLVGVALSCVGCSIADEDPLGVNGDRGADSSSSSGQSAGPEVSAAKDLGAGGQSPDSVGVGSDWGEDPLDLAQDGAILCGVQPTDSFQRYTLLLHNPTLETFTFSGVELGSPENLSILSAEVTPANKEGHNHHGAASKESGAHAGHDAAGTPLPAPTATATTPAEPRPVRGFAFVPDAHIDIVVEVALDETAETGTAENITVDFTSPNRDYSVAHPLDITVERTTCS